MGSSRSTDHYAAPPLPAPAPAVREQMSVRTSHPAEVLRVLDGDTFEARVHLWPAWTSPRAFASAASTRRR
jgi:hypothetical protein